MWRAFVLNCPSHDTLEPCRADVNNIRGTLGRFAAPGAGTNPEQLFAAGWSACFEGAMAVVARKRKFRLPADAAIDAEVDLNLNPADGTYFLRARLNISLPGVEPWRSPS